MENKIMSIREFIELVLKFEDLRENYNLNYKIYTKVFNDKEVYHEVYNVQNIYQLGYLLTEVEKYDYNVEITHITSHIGVEKGE